VNYLPNKLLKLRKHYNYSQQYLAEVLDIDALEYMAYENGGKIINYDQMKKLAALYHVDIADLFRNSEEITLYDVSKADTDELNIEYFIPKKNVFQKIGDFVSEHKIVSLVIACLMVAVIILVSILTKKQEPYVAIRDNINRLSASETNVVYIDDNGAVVGTGDNSNGQISYLPSSGAIKVCEGEGFTIILNEDGTITSIGLLSKYANEVESWSNIADIACGSNHIVAVDTTGRVYCTGDNNYGQCGVVGSKNIAKVFASANASICVDNNGQLSYSGTLVGSSNIRSHNNVIDVATSSKILVILTSDHKVYVYSTDSKNYFKAEAWKDIVDVACGEDFVAGLDAYGKVHIEIDHETISNEVNNWSNIISIDAGEEYLVAYDGNDIYGVGQNNYHQFNTSEVNKQILSQVSNVDVLTYSDHIEVQFSGVKNASGYLVSINVGTGLETRIDDTVVLFDTANMKDGKTYTISITAIGAGNYADSQPYQYKLQYEQVIEEINEDIEDVEE